ncbi:hypothetical protein AB0O01_02495 [Streptomyces sp. NPDC093252]|uniref:hypothetical protein n=1 Tax=Streptomyces sp. NPDC093252 TaxID=3154980 RepID=UPI00341F819A
MLALSTRQAGFGPLSDPARVADRTGGQIAGFLRHDHSWRHHPGDLRLPGDTDLDIALVVEGDLTVDGFLDDHVSGLGMLVVLGDLVVRDLLSWGALYVGGDLRAEGLVFGYYNDFTFEVAGAVHARALVLDDKFADYRRGALGVEIDAHEPTREQLHAARDLLVPEVYGDEEDEEECAEPLPGRPEYARVAARLHRGEPLFRRTGRATATPPHPS